MNWFWFHFTIYLGFFFLIFVSAQIRFTVGKAVDAF